MELDIIGLGKMGGNIAIQCVEKGIHVIGKARGPKPELTERGIKVVDDYREFVTFLNAPRKIFLSLPAGATVDNVVRGLVQHLDRGT